MSRNYISNTNQPSSQNLDDYIPRGVREYFEENKLGNAENFNFGYYPNLNQQNQNPDHEPSLYFPGILPPHLVSIFYPDLQPNQNQQNPNSQSYPDNSPLNGQSSSANVGDNELVALPFDYDDYQNNSIFSSQNESIAPENSQLLSGFQSLSEGFEITCDGDINSETSLLPFDQSFEGQSAVFSSELSQVENDPSCDDLCDDLIRQGSLDDQFSGNSDFQNIEQLRVSSVARNTSATTLSVHSPSQNYNSDNWC